MCFHPRTGRAHALLLAPVMSLAFLAAASPTSGQSYATTVWNQLSAQFTRANSEGFSSRNYIIGRLKNGESESWAIRLVAGNTYRITGACDGDCQDIDLVLLNSSGTELDSDLLADDFPVVSYTVTTTGTYTVRVIMARCKADPCYFGLGVFFK